MTYFLQCTESSLAGKILFRSKTWLCNYYLLFKSVLLFSDTVLVKVCFERWPMIIAALLLHEACPAGITGSSSKWHLAQPSSCYICQIPTLLTAFFLTAAQTCERAYTTDPHEGKQIRSAEQMLTGGWDRTPTGPFLILTALSSLFYPTAKAHRQRLRAFNICHHDARTAPTSLRRFCELNLQTHRRSQTRSSCPGRSSIHPGGGSLCSRQTVFCSRAPRSAPSLCWTSGTDDLPACASARNASPLFGSWDHILQTRW